MHCSVPTFHYIRPETCSDISAMIPRRDDVYLSDWLLSRWQGISSSYFEASCKYLKIPALSGVDMEYAESV